MPKFTFTSDTLPNKLPAKVRAAMWAESMRSIGSAFEMGIVASRTFRGEISVLSLGPVQVGFAKTIADGEVKVVRSDSLIATDRDDRIMIVINRGETPMTVRQFGRETSLRLGEMAVLALNIPCECSTPSSGASNVVMIPREMIDQPGKILEHYSSKRLAIDHGAQDLLATHVNNLLASEHTFDEQIEVAAGNYIVSLMKKILALPGSRQERSDHDRKPRLVSVRKSIAKNFREPDFSLDALGKELNISNRSVQKLFREHGTTFTAEVTRLRVEAAYAALKNSQKSLTVADIALQCGFTELSTFYRAFRKQYGETPNALRANQR